MGQVHTVSRNNTTVTQRGESLVVTLHSTDVVVVDTDTITLNTNGWKSATTKARMNQASNQYGLGFAVYQDKGEWFVRFRNTTRSHIPFVGNSVTFNREG